MISTQALFDQVQLAEASYSLFNDLPLGNDDALRARLLLANKNNFNGEFSPTQAADFVSKWSVSTHQANTPSGFSAILFSSKANAGEVVLAIRGTEPFVQAGISV